MSVFVTIDIGRSHKFIIKKYRQMNRDDPFIKKLKLNDRISLTVEVFGQSMKFEGLYLRLDDKDELFIQPKERDDALHFPLNSVLSGTVVESAVSSTKEDNNSDIYKNIDLDDPEFKGYFLFRGENEIDVEKILSEKIDCAFVPDELNFNAVHLLIRSIALSDFVLYFFKEDDVVDFLQTVTDLFLGKVHGDYYSVVVEFVSEKCTADKILLDKDYLRDFLVGVVCLYVNSLKLLLTDPKDDSVIKSQIRKYESYMKLCLNNSFFLVGSAGRNEESLNLYFAWTDISKELALLSRLMFNRSLFYVFLHSLFLNNRELDIESIRFYPIFMEKLFSFMLFCRDLKDADPKSFVQSELDDEQDVFEMFSDVLKVKYNIENISFSQTNYSSSMVFPIVKEHLYFPVKRLLLSYLNMCSLSDSKELYIKIWDKKQEKEFGDLIKNTYDLDVSLNDSLRIIYERFVNFKDNFMLKMILISAQAFLIMMGEKIDDDKQENKLQKLNLMITELLGSLKNNGIKYLAVSGDYLNRVISCLTRLANVTDFGKNACFSEAEESLLINKSTSKEQISVDSKEIFSEFVNKYLTRINNFSYEDVFVDYFYSRFVPEITIDLDRSCISSNSDTGTLYIPIRIHNSAGGQPVQASSLKINVSSGTYSNLHETKYRNKTIVMNDSMYHVAEIKLDDTSFPINVEVVFGYRFKSSYNFENDQFSYADTEKTENLILDGSGIKDDGFHGIKNIFRDYCSGSVVKDPKMFFGREDDIKNVIHNIRDENNRLISNRCVCIYGQTRTGKSSLLYHIKQELRKCENNLVVDLGDIGTAGSEHGFWYSILYTLAEEIESNHEDIYDRIKSKYDFGFSPDFEKLKSNENYFIDYVRQIQRLLKKEFPLAQIIILIDEFTYVYDWIKQGRFSVDFMKFWKALMTNHDICSLIVGQDHMMKFINDERFTNAFGVVKTWEVNYLDRQSAYRLITKPLSDDPEYAGRNSCSIRSDAVDALIDYTSGSAYLLMNLCADFVDYLNERHADTATRAHVEDFVQRHMSGIEERWFEPLFNDKIEFDSKDSIIQNKNILKKIADNSSDEIWTNINSLYLSTNEMVRFDNLCERHVVEKKNGKCRIAVKLYTEWLRNK